MVKKKLNNGRLGWSEKLAVLKRFERSGLTQVEFCRQEGINPWTLRDWRKRLREEEHSELFFEVGAKPNDCFEVEHLGFRVKVPAEFRAESLELLLKTIEGLKC